jgi:hypothetical protein
MRYQEFIPESPPTMPPGIGPHEGREIELMTKGTKPAALVDGAKRAEWEPVARAMGWHMVEFPVPGGTELAISKNPRDAEEIKQMIISAGEKGVTLNWHRRLGQLLGYTDAEVETYIQRLIKIFKNIR